MTTDLKPEDAVRIAFDAHKDESTRFWAVFSAMVAANSIFIGLVARSDLTRLSTVWVSLVGFAVCCLWASVQVRIDAYCAWYDLKLEELAPRCLEAKIESLLPDAKARSLFPGAARTIGKGMPWVFFAAWLGLLIIKLFCPENAYPCLCCTSDAISSHC